MHVCVSQADTPSGVTVLTKRTSSSRSQIARAEKRARESETWPIPVPSRAELTAAFAHGLDLCEGKEPGHAARVCYVALNLATAIDLPVKQQEALYYAALLHDAGATIACAELCRTLQITEESLFGAQAGMVPHQVAGRVAPANVDGVVEALHAHPREGAQVAQDLGFDAEVQGAIATHHEWWNGEGYTAELKGDQIPIMGRLVAAADLIESLIATDPNPLASRRNLESGLAEHSGSII